MARPLDLEPTANTKLDTEIDAELETDSTLEADGEVSLDAEDSSQELSTETDPESGEEGTPVEGEEKEPEAAAVDDDEIPAGPGPDPVDLGGGKQLKASDFKDPKLFDEVRRGYMRQADYTQKTQQHAQMVDGAAQIWNNYKSMAESPCPPLLNWFKPEQLLSVLAQKGYDVDPSLLKNQPQGGGAPQLDPAVSSRLQFLEKQNAENEKNSFVNNISATISEALSDIKSPQIQLYIRNRTLAALYENPNANVKELTLSMREQVRQERSAFVKAKQGKVAGTRVGKTAGGSVPVLKGPSPKSWSDASENARRRMGG